MPSKTATKKPSGSKKATDTGKTGASRGSAAGTTAKTGTAAKAKAKTRAESKAKAKAPAKGKTRAAPAKSQRKAARAAGAASPSEFKNFVPYQAKRGEEYMNDAQLDHFRHILLKWKAELMQEVDRTVTHMKDEAANFPDPADRATQEEEFSLELRTRDRERKLIKKIDQTIERLNQEDYGFCDACGVEIGIKRLEARPTATLCVDCKTLAEIKERQELG
mgnify:CR=1 FL=1